ncbi:MAG: acetylxylan esterase, partial [Trebonia sp.]
VLAAMPRHSTDDFRVSALRLTSVGPYRIFGFYSVPTGNGPFPSLLLTPRYGSVNHIPDYNDRLRYAVLQIMHRGQRLADQPLSAAYPGLLTLRIDDPATYVYRGIVADCLRGAEFLLSRPEVDPARVAIAGDDLALLTVARRPGFSYAQYAVPLLYRADEARRLTSAYPLEELNDEARANPERAAAMARTLAYFDPPYHAPRVTGTTLLSIGDDGGLDGLPWLQPLSDALGGPVEHYKLTHAGRTDHDWLDAWLAGKLGVAPMSRFRGVLT